MTASKTRKRSPAGGKAEEAPSSPASGKTEREKTVFDPLATLREEIRGKWGEGVMASAASILDDPPAVLPVGPWLDLSLSGGVPEGSWVSVSGAPKSGKTTTLLSFAARCQEPVNGSRRIHYFNIEKRLKKKNLAGIEGLNLAADRFVIYESTPGCILSGEDFLEIAVHVLRTDPGAVVILDSVSALVQSAVLDGGLKTETRGGGAKTMSRFIDIVASVVPVRRSIVLGVTHLISDTSGRSQGPVEKAANRWLYQADVRLRVKWAESWTAGEREIGKIVHWTCQESALGPPGGKCSSWIRYGLGIDRVQETVEMAKAAGLIRGSGAWFELTWLGPDPETGKPPKLQGGEKLWKDLRARPDRFASLEKAVREMTVPGENRPEENRPEENRPEENRPEENRPEENRPEENRPEEKESPG